MNILNEMLALNIKPENDTFHMHPDTRTRLISEGVNISNYNIETWFLYPLDDISLAPSMFYID